MKKHPGKILHLLLSKNSNRLASPRAGDYKESMELVQLASKIQREMGVVEKSVNWEEKS